MTPIRRMVRVVIGLATRLPSSFRQVAVRMSGVPARPAHPHTASARQSLGVAARYHDAVAAEVHDPAQHRTRSAAMYARAGTTQWLRTKGRRRAWWSSPFWAAATRVSLPAQPVQPGGRCRRVTRPWWPPR